MTVTRRGTLGLGAVLLGTELAHRARAATPAAPAAMPGLTIEKGASLRVLRPAKFLDPDERVFNENTQRFAKENNITIRVDYAAWEDLRPQTAVTANTGAGQDVILGWTDDPHLYAEKLVDLTDVADYLGRKYGGWYPLAERYGKKFGTQQWIALPVGANGGLLVYRESWLKEAGFDAAPRTTDEMLACCRKLKATGHPVGFALGHGVGDGNAFCHWLVWTFGGTMVDENQKVTINSRETIEALKYGRALYETFIPGTNSWNDTSNNKALIAREISMTQNGVSLYYSIKTSQDPKVAAMAADLNHAHMPVGPVGRPTEAMLAMNAMVFRHTKAPNAAKAYLAYMMEAPQYDRWLNDIFGFWGQPLRAYEASAVWTFDPRVAVFKDAMRDGLWYGYKGPINEASGAVVADWVMVDMVAAALTGASTPEDAAQEAERRARRYYRG